MFRSVLHIICSNLVVSLRSQDGNKVERNMPRCYRNVQVVQSPEKMRAGLINVIDN